MIWWALVLFVVGCFVLWRSWLYSATALEDDASFLIPGIIGFAMVVAGICMVIIYRLTN